MRGGNPEGFPPLSFSRFLEGGGIGSLKLASWTKVLASLKLSAETKILAALKLCAETKILTSLKLCAQTKILASLKLSAETKNFNIAEAQRRNKNLRERYYSSLIGSRLPGLCPDHNHGYAILLAGFFAGIRFLRGLEEGGEGEAGGVVGGSVVG